MSQLIRHPEISGTLDEMEPRLRALGFTGLRMSSGVADLAVADPYGMRHIGSVNIHGEKDAHHVWRGVLAQASRTGRWYLTDQREATSPLINGLFELVTSAVTVETTIKMIDDVETLVQTAYLLAVQFANKRMRMWADESLTKFPEHHTTVMFGIGVYVEVNGSHVTEDEIEGWAFNDVPFYVALKWALDDVMAITARLKRGTPDVVTF